MIPYKVQFDKLTEAYINDKVNPYKECACFIGNLLNGSNRWAICRSYAVYGRSSMLGPLLSDYMDIAIARISEMSLGTYEPIEIVILENKFLHILERETVGEAGMTSSYRVFEHPNYEEALFLAFCGTLDLLKRIHESKGEVVDDFTFTKRTLQTANSA